MVAIAVSYLARALGFSNLLSISSTCTSELTSLALSSAGDCLNIAGLVPLVTLSSGASIIPDIDSWLTGLCGSISTSTCTNATLEALGTNITNACGSDLEGLGLSSSMVSEIPALLQEYYLVGAEALCTRNTNNGSEHCVTSELEILQSSLGTNLTASNVVSAAANVLSNTTLEKEVACTTCIQGVYAILKPELSSSVSSEVESELNDICGSGFATSTEPSGIIVATGTLATQTATSTSTNAANSIRAPLFGASSGMTGLALLASAGACVLGASSLF